jgi:dihydrofolate reductase
MIRMIAAMSRNRAIGRDNSLLWRLSGDMKRFKELTTGSSVIMGRKTYESIGKPLPNRRNIIITRDLEYSAEGCEAVNSLEEALLLSNSDCFIIGGGEIYSQAMPMADKIYLTLVNGDFEGDAFFPEIGKEWAKVSRQDFKKDEKNEHDYSFIEYERHQF